MAVTFRRGETARNEDRPKLNERKRGSGWGEEPTLLEEGDVIGRVEPVGNSFPLDEFIQTVTVERGSRHLSHTF